MPGTVNKKSREELKAELELLIECLNRDGHVRLKVLGDSMKPSIKNGDFIEIFKSKHAFLGDTLAVFRNDELLAHRLIWPPFVRLNRDGRIWLKGDSRRRSDGIFRTCDCLGRVQNLSRQQMPRIIYLVLSALSALQRVNWVSHLSRFCQHGVRL